MLEGASCIVEGFVDCLGPQRVQDMDIITVKGVACMNKFTTMISKHLTVSFFGTLIVPPPEFAPDVDMSFVCICSWYFNGCIAIV